jgi:hypothetical protein
MSESLPPLSPNFAAEKERVAKEEVETHGKWPVHYQFRPARGDHRHLLVVFSSVGSKYGFGTKLDSVQCNVLRIRDHFDGAASYYVCRNMDFTVSDAIQSLIEGFMRRLRITRNEVTLLGASKGGSAALYHGVKYDYKNIVASTPQYFLGSYSRGHGQLGDAVLGEGQSDEHVKIMDSVMPAVLEKEVDFARNIYLVSSPGDYQYEQEVRHYLPALRKYENFNFFFVDSPTVRRHDEVVRQALPLLWSIVHSLTEGTVPRWGDDVRVGPAPEDSEQASAHLADLRKRNTALAVLTRAAFADGRLQLSGHAFLPGISADGGAEQETKRLVLEKDGEHLAFPLKTTKEIRLYREYFDEYFCEYADGGFASEETLTLDALPAGTYDVSVSTASKSEGIERRTRLVSHAAVDRRHAAGGFETLVKGGKGGVRIIRRSVVGRDADGLRFSPGLWEQRGKSVHAEGVFFLPGRNADREGHARYYLVLQGKSGCHSFPLGAQKNAERVRRHVDSGDIGNYDFGYFTTPRGGGVDVTDVPAGRYNLLVSMSAGGALFTKKIGKLTLK